MTAPQRISLAEALRHALRIGGERAVSVETVSVADVSGRVLGEDVRLPADLPPFAHAAMDGYAIAGAAKSGARFVVEGESRAGAPSSSSASPGHAVAISTGGAIPEGTDTVVPWEDVHRDGAELTLRRDARETQHVRRAGEDAPAGLLVAARGTLLGPHHVPVLATAERAAVLVARRPRVAILVTGDELRAPGEPPRPGAIVDSNGPMLVAMVRAFGGEPTTVSVADRPGALEAALAEARTRADAVVTVGGAADGEHDHVARALTALGAETVFRGVAIRPGKPVGLASAGALPILTLPGNPGSAYVTFALFGGALLRAMTGDSAAAPRLVPARLTSAVRSSTDRLVVVYGALTVEDTTLCFTPGPGAASGSVAGLLGASTLALVPPGQDLGAGARVETLSVANAPVSPVV